MERFSFDAELPAWMPATRMHPFTRAPYWQTGLYEFLTFEVPTGSVATIDKAARKMRSGFAGIFPTLLLGNTGLPRRLLLSDEEEHAQSMARAAEPIAIASGKVLAGGLYRMSEKYGIPDTADLVRFLTTTYRSCDPVSADILARALRMHWRGETLEAATFVLPALEAAARRLLRETDTGIYKVQMGQASGEYPTLRGLLDALDEVGLDPDWSWYLNWLLLGPIGKNIRNDIAHGFITSIGSVHSALVLRAAALLITMSTSVDGENRTLRVPEREPINGVRRVVDEVARRASAQALRSHVFLERLRTSLRPPSDLGR